MGHPRAQTPRGPEAGGRRGAGLSDQKRRPLGQAARLFPACPLAGEARGAQPRASRISSRPLPPAAPHRCSPAGPRGPRFRDPGLVPEGAGMGRPGALSTWQRLREHLADEEHGWLGAWARRAARLRAPTVCQARRWRCLLPSSWLPMQERNDGSLPVTVGETETRRV